MSPASAASCNSCRLSKTKCTLASETRGFRGKWGLYMWLMANMHPDLAAAAGINVDAGQDAFLRRIRRQPPAWFIAVCKGARAPRGKPEPNSPAVWDGPPLLGDVENSGKGKGKAASGSKTAEVPTRSAKTKNSRKRARSRSVRSAASTPPPSSEPRTPGGPGEDVEMPPEVPGKCLRPTVWLHTDSDLKAAHGATCPRSRIRRRPHRPPCSWQGG